MSKRRLFALTSMLGLASLFGSSRIEAVEPEPEKQPAPKKPEPKSNRSTKYKPVSYQTSKTNQQTFTIDGITVQALNRRNAERKVRNIQKANQQA